MAINFLAVMVCAVLSLVVGAVWYGPIFGKAWMHILGANLENAEEKKRMQKQAMPLYAVQILLSLFQIYVLAYYIAGWEGASGLENALWIWAAFIVPTIAASSMWTNKTTTVKWSQFLIQAGYQCVMFILYGIILGIWS